MGDDGKGISFGSGSNGQNQQAIGDGGEPGGEPKYITLEEARALAKAEAEAAFRAAQSLSDKAESRIQRQVTERLAEIERSYQLINGQELPADQREGLRQRVIADVIAGGSSSNSQPGNQSAQHSGATGREDPDQIEIEYTDRYTQELWEEYSMQIDEEDPEARQLDFTSPKAFRKSLRPALEAKKERLTGSQSGNGDPTSRIPALGSGGTKGNPIAGTMDSNELWKMAQQRRRSK